MTRRAFLFVHSPLVGPSSMHRLAKTAKAEGHAVALPDLTSITQAAAPHAAFVDLAVTGARELSDPVTVVGHSGAGVFLPAIGAAVTNLAGLVFVDAVVPAAAGTHHTPIGLKAMLDEQTVDGRLRPWLDWWPDEALADLLPDPADRVTLGSDMPRLPRSFYDVDVPLPPTWSDRLRCGFVGLSPAYNAETTEARSRGWPTVELASTHLGLHTNPVEVLDAIKLVSDSHQAGASGS